MSNLISSALGGYADFFAALGFLMTTCVVGKFVVGLLGGIKIYMLSHGVNLKRFGPWAVVTGATDGIGKAYAQELAKEGLNIVLVSRNPEKLADVAAEIESKSSVKTKCIAVDFTGGPEIYDKIKSEFGDTDVGVLVNNVGMGYEYPEYFADLPDDKKIRDLMNVNTNSVVEMCRLILPGMAEKKRGCIINISSASGFRPTPLLTVYSGTKAFVDFFSRALQMEYKNKGIIIQSVMPFFVTTKLSGLHRTSFMIPSPTTYVRTALRTVGQTSRTFGCLSHALQGYITAIVPDCVMEHVGMKILLSGRARYFKKKQRIQKAQ